MADRAIDSIREVNSDRLGFHWFRSTFMTDHGLKDSLDYGHSIIGEVNQLDQYLHTYGPMIESQWKNVAGALATIDPPGLMIDYGCGQGLAGLHAHDLTQGHILGEVRDIALIEPSALALARAAALYARLAPAATVSCVCKPFDDVKKRDVPHHGAGKALHLFSNSLDVLGFNPLKLLSKTLRSGHHTILSVSHDREFNGGTPRIQSVKAALEDPSLASEVTIRRSTLERFTCDNPSRSKGVAWLCELEVRDG